MTLDIMKTVEIFNNAVQICTKGDNLDIEKLWLVYMKLDCSDEEKKVAIDQCFINLLHNLVKTYSELTVIVNFLNFIILAVEKELCSILTLFIGLTDVFDLITLSESDQLFSFIEDRVDVWKSNLFYNSGKNYLLRMCNDLLRRLSKSQNTIFCGRIQLFLARLFPLEERSGLNLMSQFNLENLTTYSDQLLVDTENHLEDAKMDIAGDDLKSNPIDYNLYWKLWQLQDYFRNPTLCFEKSLWTDFLKSTEEILTCFKSFKLENVAYKRKDMDVANLKTRDSADEKETVSQISDSTNDTPYFAKYLTSEKLLDLQLSDSNFRRNILIQFLITYQYLTASVKSKTSNQVLTEEQASIINNLTKKVYELLDETPPDGPNFSKIIQHILTREENWNSWKNEGCVNYIRKKDDPKNKPVIMPKSKKRSMVNELRHPSSAKIIRMGNAELTRLWNIPAASSARNFVPTVESFFEEAVAQLQPQSGVEDQYKLVNDPTFSWKALRLLSRSHPLFFTQQPQVSAAAATPSSTQTPKTTAQFLESIIGKMVKEGSAMQQQVQCVVDKKPDFSNSKKEAAAEEDDLNNGNYENAINEGEDSVEEEVANEEEEEEQEEEQEEVDREAENEKDEIVEDAN